MFTLLIAALSMVVMASGFGYHSFNSGFSSGGYSSNSVFGSSKSNCPQQVDFSADLQLSANITGFPQEALDAELIARPDLSLCLSRVLVPPTAPQVPDDPALLNSQDTCPHQTFKLTRYFNNNGLCWIIEAVQEQVNFTVCQTQQCVGCNDFFSGWGSQNRCVRQYRYLSVWAFCEGLPLNQRIIRDRIVLPFACTCQKIRCYSNSFFWRK